LRISLPYHDHRMPPKLTRADYAVSANIGRTIDATRQAVIDVRSCYDWLEHRGYTDLGIVGTSLGSCYAFLATARSENPGECFQSLLDLLRGCRVDRPFHAPYQAGD
jgi:dienelactone hydrolase